MITPGGVLANLNGWSFTVNGCENRYKMTEEEADAIKPVLVRNQPSGRNYYTDRAGSACPSCGNDVANVDVFCRWCGKRLSKED
jgi:hypothetical protein